LPRWVWGLAGLGLFLSGAILGAVLMASVTLYRLPTTPATPAATVAPSTVALVATHLPQPAEPLPTAPPRTYLRVGPGVGQMAPLFALPGLDGITYTLAAYEGRTVIVNFWASWCPPCRQEWPELRAFAERLTSTAVILLAVDVEETPEVVAEFVGTATLSFPILLDQDGQVSERYRVGALPTTFVIDPGGLVRQVVPGTMDAATLEGLVHR
jgi:thiol-disulfide isomerase/thioredoxin